MKPLKVLCLYFSQVTQEKNDWLQSVAESLLRFSPQVSIREPNVIFVEIGGSAHLFHSEKRLILKIQALARRFASPFRLAVAPNPPAALAMARRNLFVRDDLSYNQILKLLPISCLWDFVSPFRAPVLPGQKSPWGGDAYHEALYRKINKTVETLELLGLENLADFLEIPTHTLVSRLGAEVLRLSSQVKNQHTWVWPRFVPPKKVEERLELSEAGQWGPCDSLEPLLFLSKKIVDRAMSRLRGRGCRASAVSLDCELESYSHLKERRRSWQLQLPTPQGSASALLPILRDRMAYELQSKPLGAPVTHLTFRVEECAPGHGMQKNFFNQQEVELEAMDALLGRLQLKLGPSSVFSAQTVDRYLPEKAWEKTVVSAMKSFLHEDFFKNKTKLNQNQEGDCPMPTLAQKLDPSRLSVSSSLVEKQKSRLKDSPMSAAALSLKLFARRPTRVLKKPQPLSREGDFLFHKNKNKCWRAIQWHGPERLEGEWWQTSRFSRDYYRVSTDNGVDLWVFEVPGMGFYLHGFFD